MQTIDNFVRSFLFAAVFGLCTRCENDVYFNNTVAIRGLLGHDMTVAGRVRQVVAIYRSKTKEISWWDQR